jgi:hypothetical protein
MDNIDYAKNICLRGADRASRCCRKSGIAWAATVCSLPVPAPATSARRPPLALSEHERRVALDVLNNLR